MSLILKSSGLVVGWHVILSQSEDFSYVDLVDNVDIVRHLHLFHPAEINRTSERERQCHTILISRDAYNFSEEVGWEEF